jgi:hypothetical protein
MSFKETFDDDTKLFVEFMRKYLMNSKWFVETKRMSRRNV